jgi:hypothetical protein
MIDLAIAYRIYPGVSKTPAVFTKDKFNLSAICLHSFKEALGNLRVKIWALLDDCPDEYEDLFRSHFGEDELEIVQLGRVGNLSTFSLQLDLLTRNTDAELVYFAEDDYFYLPDAIDNMVAFTRANSDVDFVTPYDHPDTYNESSRYEKHRLRVFGGRHWRTATSTCLTFLASRRSLLSAESIFRTYCRGNMDCPIWLSLTEKAGLGDLRVHWHDAFRFKTWLKTWRWGLSQILFGRSYRLWSPLPTLATHMESTCLSPGIDWSACFDRATRTLEALKGR